MEDVHFSWSVNTKMGKNGGRRINSTDTDKFAEDQIIELQERQVKSSEDLLKLKASNEFRVKDESLICSTQYNDTIPVFDARILIENITFKDDRNLDDCVSLKTRLSQKLYNIFFDGAGCFILRNGYTTSLMRDFNFWCEQMIGEENENIGKEKTGTNGNQSVSEDKNFIHPTQKGKYLINDVLSRLAKTNPSLLYQLLYDSNGAYVLHQLMDVLLGFGKVGAAAAHWITPNSNTKQLSHVDFPLNINSSPFWGMSQEKMKKYTTVTQMNQILPHYSCQVLIAADSMNETNGSTEVIPCSQSIPNLDLEIAKGSRFYDTLENVGLFQNVELGQGDILVFNRRLIHRGGANRSMKRRNALIMQYVWLWGVGQEMLDVHMIIPKLLDAHKQRKKKDEDNEKSEFRESFNEFMVRINPPYPKDTRLGT